MIKPNELRTGNIVLFRDDIVEINSIGTAWHTHRYIDGYGPHISPKRRVNEYSPIPLTEDILLKCGYLKIDSNNYQIQGHQIWVVNGLITCDKIGIIIKSLHQLQNLYFALTGKELTINL